MKYLVARLKFALRHRTLRPVAVDPGNTSRVIVCHAGAEVHLPRRCPHQGAPLETGRVHDGQLFCPWHGCHYDLESRKFIRQQCTPRRL